ncbi:glycosyltransferase family 4 protein [Brevibacterium siliguriense]|uniref:glycosyltransferase family 4 protein n=1 Tax=Brevibacterium siliguriense TaxID=1136497 RepID=UPI000B80F65E|nr:glycosyltransferase family 4 protein [Brevibacterium siliguriense]
MDTDVTRTPADMRRSLGLPGDGIWVGTAASIVGYEGLDDLVDAVILARSQGTDLRLLIAGDGVALPELRERAAVLGENAVFTGRVSQSQAIEYQLALDAIVVPRKDEPVCRLVTPIKPIEAMGLARPVVISDLPALRELVRTVQVCRHRRRIR